jgi:hypothetical protein
MGLKKLSETFFTGIPVRGQNLQADHEKSVQTIDSFRLYKKHMGAFRYYILVEA